jgi:putative pyruvate formate lyase activating enzyme
MFYFYEVMISYYSEEEKALLGKCTICPRECGVNRFRGGEGYCGTDADLNIASICVHRGEEPPVSGPDGICNIFFAACNLQCIYCQNHDISRPGSGKGNHPVNYEEALNIICSILSKGIKSVGFVSPSHVVPQMKALIRGIKKRGFSPVTVYNTNGYDKRETIKELAGIIDVYLPDYKYSTPEISLSYSDSYDYPEVAIGALREMYFQKGSSLHMDENGIAESGILIRHLVLPGHAEESKKVLRKIAEELSPGVHISLMSQYHPTLQVRNHMVINRPLYIEEYNSVAAEMERLGFRNGWLQDPGSYDNYLPDFSKKHPFE